MAGEASAEDTDCGTLWHGAGDVEGDTLLAH